MDKIKQELSVENLLPNQKYSTDSVQMTSLFHKDLGTHHQIRQKSHEIIQRAKQSIATRSVDKMNAKISPSPRGLIHKTPKVKNQISQKQLLDDLDRRAEMKHFYGNSNYNSS